MSIGTKLFAQMRATTRSLLRRAPAASRSALREAAKPASALPAARNAMPPNPFHPPFPPVVDHPFVDLLAGLGRIGQPGADPFGFPSLFGAGQAPGLPGKVIDASYGNAAGTRSYKLYVPSTYTGAASRQACALLVMLHGCSQNPDDFALGTGMNALAEEYGCLVAYPAQSQGANASRCWNWFNAVDQQHGQGEPSIIAGITREIMARYAVDPHQVYVAGLSAGGAMAAIMGTLYPDLYAAVGVHSGLPFAAAHDLASAMAAMQGAVRSAMQGDARRAQAPGRGIPIIVFHGDRDTTVHPANGDELIGQRRRYPQDVVEVEPGQVPHGHAYTRTLHRRADGSLHAEHWVVHGSGHAWSGGDARASYTDARGPSASQAMLRFFRTAR